MVRGAQGRGEPPPLALKHVNEPLANTQNYDRLREKSLTD